MLSFIVFILGALHLTTALTITAPTNSSGWSSLTGPNEISWTSDTEESFVINVIYPYQPDYNLMVAYYTNMTSGSFYFTSATPIQAASGYVVNIVANNGTTLATSGDFTVTGS